MSWLWIILAFFVGRWSHHVYIGTNVAKYEAARVAVLYTPRRSR